MGGTRPYQVFIAVTSPKPQVGTYRSTTQANLSERSKWTRNVLGMPFPYRGAITIYPYMTPTTWPTSGEPLPLRKKQDHRLATPNLLSEGEEEKYSLSSEDDVDFDDVGVKAMSLIRGNVPIFPFTSWFSFSHNRYGSNGLANLP